MKVLRWVADRLKDLFYDPTNTHLDPGRVLGWFLALSVIAAAVWNVHLGKEIDLGVSGYPGGLAAILGALAIYIIKDRQQASRS